jgi:hypothetical protein
MAMLTNQEKCYPRKRVPERESWLNMCVLPPSTEDIFN